MAWKNHKMRRKRNIFTKQARDLTISWSIAQELSRLRLSPAEHAELAKTECVKCAYSAKNRKRLFVCTRIETIGSSGRAEYADLSRVDEAVKRCIGEREEATRPAGGRAV